MAYKYCRRWWLSTGIFETTASLQMTWISVTATNVTILKQVEIMIIPSTLSLPGFSSPPIKSTVFPHEICSLGYKYLINTLNRHCNPSYTTSSDYDGNGGIEKVLTRLWPLHRGSGPGVEAFKFPGCPFAKALPLPNSDHIILWRCNICKQKLLLQLEMNAYFQKLECIRSFWIQEALAA